jgi:hypothetical protein
MNKNGNPRTLVASHPGNTNAAKYGVYSQRLIQPRAAEIVELIESFDFAVTQRLAVGEVARLVAIIEAIDRDLDERGLVDKRGEARSLLNHRSRMSRQLYRWLAEIAPSIERQSAGERADVGRSEYVHELQWIALGKDARASAHDRVSAIKELLNAEAPLQPQPQVVTLVIRDDEVEQIEYPDEMPDGEPVNTET